MTMKPFGVVIPNRYPELAEKFIGSIRDTHAQMPDVVVVRDRHDATFGEDVKTIDGVEPFIYARNCNLGMQYFADRDVFLCNDDLVCVEQEFFPCLASIASQYPKCGIFSPLVKGGIGNKMQDYHEQEKMWAGKPDEVAVTTTLHFPCVLLLRRMVHRIGLLDENFAGYGFEDVDYCIRAFRNGWQLMITRQLHIQHGDGAEGLTRGENYSLSFAKERLENLSDNLSVDYFSRKYANDLMLNDQRSIGSVSRL